MQCIVWKFERLSVNAREPQPRLLNWCDEFSWKLSYHLEHAVSDTESKFSAQNLLISRRYESRTESTENAFWSFPSPLTGSASATSAHRHSVDSWNLHHSCSLIPRTLPSYSVLTRSESEGSRTLNSWEVTTTGTERRPPDQRDGFRWKFFSGYPSLALSASTTKSLGFDWDPFQLSRSRFVTMALKWCSAIRLILTYVIKASVLRILTQNGCKNIESLGFQCFYWKHYKIIRNSLSRDTNFDASENQQSISPSS